MTLARVVNKCQAVALNQGSFAVKSILEMLNKSFESALKKSKDLLLQSFRYLQMKSLKAH